MVKKKHKRPLAPEPIVVNDLNQIWVYYRKPNLIYPIPWKGWLTVEDINKLKNLLKNVTKINVHKGRH
jgi:hypothetical protein